jgi:hypothetical protein
MELPSLLAFGHNPIRRIKAEHEEGAGGMRAILIVEIRCPYLFAHELAPMWPLRDLRAHTGISERDVGVLFRPTSPYNHAAFSIEGDG